jgi:hypothetical protein
MPSKTAQDRPSLCSFHFADGRQCCMLKKNKTSNFCYFHQLHADQAADAIEAGEQIASCLTSDFVTDCSLTTALSRTFISVARGDYDIRTARTLAYLTQLMSKALPGARQELSLSVGHDNMIRVVEYCLARVNEQFRRPTRQPAPPAPKSQSPQPTTTEPATSNSPR